MAKIAKKQILPEVETHPQFIEKTLEINRVSRTIKGGRRISFRVLVAVGDGKGKVGIGLGKGKDVSLAVQKAAKKAKKSMVDVPIVKGTIPYPVEVKVGRAKIRFKPAPEGSTVIAGGVVRILAEVAGIRNLSAKILGSKSKINNALATIEAFKKLKERLPKR